MKRIHLLTLVSLLSLGIAWAVHSTKASDDLGDSNTDAAKVLSSLELLERIELLEKRVTQLEGRVPVIRQAMSREAPVISQPGVLAQEPIGQATSRNQKPASREVPPISEDEEVEITNGQKWKFRLLGNRLLETRRK